MMRFRINRTSDQGTGGGGRPCLIAYAGDVNGSLVWVIDIDTLEDLIRFQKTVERPIVIEDDYMIDGQLMIQIEDDYRG